MTESELAGFIASRRRILAAKVAVASLLIVLVAAGGTFAWFKAIGNGTANASVGSLQTPVATATNPSTGVGHVTWTQVKVTPDDPSADTLAT